MDLSITAIISKEWKQRMLLMMLIIGGAGGWFLYDGLVGYPNNNVRAAVYFPLKEELGADTPELDKAWTEAARERGWSDKAPKKIYSAGDVRTQVIIAAVALLGAGLVAWNFFSSLKTTTRLEGNTILLPDGRSIPIDRVRAVSKRRWDSKGIADLVYDAGPGKRKKFLLDDYKYVGAEKILVEVEKSLGQQSAPEPEEKPPAEPGVY